VTKRTTLLKRKKTNKKNAKGRMLGGKGERRVNLLISRFPGTKSLKIGRPYETPFCCAKNGEVKKKGLKVWEDRKGVGRSRKKSKPFMTAYPRPELPYFEDRDRKKKVKKATEQRLAEQKGKPWARMGLNMSSVLEENKHPSKIRTEESCGLNRRLKGIPLFRGDYIGSISTTTGEKGWMGRHTRIQEATNERSTLEGKKNRIQFMELEETPKDIITQMNKFGGSTMRSINERKKKNQGHKFLFGTSFF